MPQTNINQYVGKEIGKILNKYKLNDYEIINIYIADQFKMVNLKLADNTKEFNELIVETITSTDGNIVPPLVVNIYVEENNQVWQKYRDHIAQEVVEFLTSIENDKLIEKINIAASDAIYTSIINLLSDNKVVICKKCFNTTPLFYATGDYHFKKKIIQEFECRHCGHKEQYKFSRNLPQSDGLIVNEISKLCKLGYNVLYDQIPTYGQYNGSIVFTKRHNNIEDIIRNDKTMDLKCQDPELNNGKTSIVMKEKDDEYCDGSEHTIKFVNDIKRLVEILEKQHKI